MTPIKIVPVLSQGSDSGAHKAVIVDMLCMLKTINCPWCNSWCFLIIEYQTQLCHLIGTPSFAGGGLVTASFSGLFGEFTGLITLGSSALVSRCKKLLSLTGLPLVAPGRLPLGAPLLGPLLLLLGPGDVRCGIFSGRGCWLPMEVTPPSEALPAFERA